METTLSIVPTLGSNFMNSGKLLDMTAPNLSKITNVTAIKSELLYAIPEFNLSTAQQVTSAYSDLTTRMAYKRRRRPYRPRRPRIPHLDFLMTVDRVVMPVALSLGIVGSLFLIPVFTCTPLKASALSHYLTAIGVSDFLYLIACLAVWISKQGYRFNNIIGVCQLTMFTLRLSRFLGTWYLFAAHVERCLVHFGSRRARVWCSTFRTKCIILGFFIFSLVGFLHYIWTHVVVEDVGRARCTVMAESLKHFMKLGKIELVVSVFFPMLLIMPIDVALIISLVLRRQRAASIRRSIKGNNNNSSRSSTSSGGDNHGAFREERMEGYVLAGRRRSRSPSNRSGDSTPPPPEFDLSRQRSYATAVVIISGLLFIGLLLPSSIYHAKIFFQDIFEPSPQDLFNMKLFEQLDKLNSVFKCFLYFSLLRGFRHGALYIRHCHRKRKSCENSLQETEV